MHLVISVTITRAMAADVMRQRCFSVRRGPRRQIGKGHRLSFKRSPFVLYLSMFYKLIVCFAKTYFLSFPPPIFILVLWLWHLLKECKPTLVIRGGFRATDSSRGRGITSDFFGPMNVHRGTVISVIVTVNLFCCILYGRATL